MFGFWSQTRGTRGISTGAVRTIGPSHGSRDVSRFAGRGILQRAGDYRKKNDLRNGVQCRRAHMDRIVCWERMDLIPAGEHQAEVAPIDHVKGQHPPRQPSGRTTGKDSESAADQATCGDRRRDPIKVPGAQSSRDGQGKSKCEHRSGRSDQKTFGASLIPRPNQIRARWLAF